MAAILFLFRSSARDVPCFRRKALPMSGEALGRALLCAVLDKILNRLCAVDDLSFGEWNYNPATKTFPDRAGFYAEQMRKVRTFRRKRGINCER
jgi:hypothetical protein